MPRICQGFRDGTSLIGKAAWGSTNQAFPLETREGCPFHLELGTPKPG